MKDRATGPASVKPLWKKSTSRWKWVTISRTRGPVTGNPEDNPGSDIQSFRGLLCHFEHKGASRRSITGMLYVIWVENMAKKGDNGCSTDTNKRWPKVSPNRAYDPGFGFLNNQGSVGVKSWE